MRNELRLFIVTILFIGTLCLAGYFDALCMGNHTTEIGMVISSTEIDCGGEIWGYDTPYPKGTTVKVTFDDNGTSSIYDDVIVRVAKF